MQQYPLVTVVGGSGFVGRHVVKALATAGYRIRVLVRDTIAAEHLKTCATVGQIAIEHADITRPETLAGKFVGSMAVVNLVSILYESGRQKFDRINIEGARAVVAEARKAGAVAFVHISALGANRATDTRYGRTKLAGEEAVMKEFPAATILRPSLIVGPEDGFFQRFARMSMISPALPLIGGGHTKFQPVLVTDVARTVLEVLLRPETAGQTYAVVGPKTYSFRAMLELMASITGRRTWLVPVPSWMASIKAFFLELMPFAPLITRDQVKLLKHDNIAGEGDVTTAALGLAPQAIEDVLPQLLSRYIKD